MNTTHTLYAYTCSICESIASFVTKSYHVCSGIVTSMGYARAAAELARQGYFEEAKYLIIERKKLEATKNA